MPLHPSTLRVEGLKQAPLACALPHVLEDEIVDLRTDAADDPAAALRQPKLRTGMFEPGVLLRVQQAVDLVLQRGDPGGIVPVDLPREVNEGLAVRFGLYGANAERCHPPWLARQAVVRQPRPVVAPCSRHYLLAEALKL